MHLTRAVITAAGPNQRQIPLQTLVDQDGETRSLLAITVRAALGAGVEEVCVVVYPGDERAYGAALGPMAERVTFVTQPEPRGYGDAILCARPFVKKQPFLHLIGDHVFVSTAQRSCVEQVIEAATDNDCAVSAVVATREAMLPYFGAVGARRVPGSPELFEIERVMEKPAPTQAEQFLIGAAQCQRKLRRQQAVGHIHRIPQSLHVQGEIALSPGKLIQRWTELEALAGAEALSMLGQDFHDGRRQHVNA